VKKQYVDDAIAEAYRFIKKAEELQKCTASAELKFKDHYEKYGYDKGLNNGWVGPSKTRAAVKRAAIDLKHELTKLNK